MSKLKYKRVVLKLSGEMLQGKQWGGIDFAVARAMVNEIKTIVEVGCEVAVVVGAGNFFRGREHRHIQVDQVTADYMGMLGTVMNALALRTLCQIEEIPVLGLSALRVPQAIEEYTAERMNDALARGKVVILGGGTGNPYFSTDTAVAVRAAEAEADAVLKATKVDGVYDKDPMMHSDAKKYESLTFNQALKEKLKVMDAAAFSLCQETKIPILVFRYAKGSLLKAVRGEKIGTLVHS